MRKKLLFLLIFILIFSTSSSFAEPGDIIHTGLRKIYRKGTTEITENLINDIKNKIDISKFYRELDDGNYVNVQDEETTHLDYIRNIISSNNIKTSEELILYISNNQISFENGLKSKTDSISKAFNEIDDPYKGSIEDYIGASAAIKLTSANFSTPEIGSIVGSTKIQRLALPVGAYKWEINITDDRVLEVKKDSIVQNGLSYIAGVDIPVIAGKYLNLYALDRNNMIFGYSSIEITEDMIRKPTKYAHKLEGLIPLPGEEEGTTKFESLDFGDLDANVWNVYISKSTIIVPELDSLPYGDSYSPGEDITISVGDRLLLTALKDNKIKAYSLFILEEDHIKPIESTDDKTKPILLRSGIHYSNPVKADTVGNTKFASLNPGNLEGDIVWRYFVSDNIIPVPELDSMIDGSKDILHNKAIVSSLEEINIKGSVNKHIILLATINDGSDYKIKGYALLKVNESNVKLPNAKGLVLDENYSKPTKGTSPNTTKISSLDSNGIAGFSQWRYKVVKDLPDEIELNSVLANSSFYNSGGNIPSANIGDYLIIAGTDGYSKVKAYSIIKLDSSMVRGANANMLVAPANYVLGDPRPGATEGTTKFDYLNFSTNIIGASKWMIATSSKAFGYIELDSIIEDSKTIVSGNDIEVSINDYMVLLATDVNGKVKGYKEFRLAESNIRSGEPAILAQGTGLGKNYVLDRGITPGTSRFNSLKFDGVFGATAWRVKWLDKELEPSDLPYLNKIVEAANIYSVYNNMGQDIKVSWVSTEDKYGYILLLAVDNMGRTKGYKLVPVHADQVKEHAPYLDDNIKIKEGIDADQVAIEGLVEGKLYRYILGDREFATPAKGDLLTNGTPYNGQGIVARIGQHLTIFEVNIEDKIQSFKRFVITEDVIKLGSAEFRLTNGIDGENAILMGGIVNGGSVLEIKLTDAKWVDLKMDKTLRDRLFNGLKANNQNNQWFNVISVLMNDGGGITISPDKTTLTIYLAKTPGYAINEDQFITLTIPGEAIGAINPITADGFIVVKPTIKANITGDFISGVIREVDIKKGGAKIVINLLDGKWIGNIDPVTLTNGFSGSPTMDAILALIKPKDIVRNSSSQLTISLPKADLNVEFKEDITLTIDKALVDGAISHITASPIFSIYPNMLNIAGTTVKDTVIMQAPDGKEILANNDTWEVELTSGNFKEDLTDKDIILSNLPSGLKYTIERISGTNLKITLAGVSNSPITGDRNVLLKVKSEAVEESNAIDSASIILKIKVNEAMVFDDINYSINYLGEEGIYLLVNENMVDKVQYSINTTNGINGVWNDVTTKAQLISSNLIPIKVWVREIGQLKVFREMKFDLLYANTPDNVSISHIHYNGPIKVITLSGADASMEYSLNGGNAWVGFDNNTIELDKNSDLRIRKATTIGEGGNLPSLPTKRLNGLYLGDVEIKVGAGKISNTNTSIEYSLNSSGVDAVWKIARPNETLVEFNKGNRVWIREGKSNINTRELGVVEQKPKPNKEDVDYNIMEGTITNNSSDNLEYKLASGNWLNLNSESTVDKIIFVSGDFMVRTKGDSTTLPSIAETIATIPAAIDPPELKGDDNNKVISYLDGIWKPLDENFQYKIGSNGVWKLGSEFATDEERLESVIIYVRKIGSKELLPSKDKAIEFTKNLIIDGNVKYNVARKSLEGTNSKMEYSINNKNEKNGIWKPASNTSTTIEAFEGMYLWLREANKPITEVTVVSNLERHKLSIGDLNTVYYNVESSKIANYSANNLEYRISGGSWYRADSMDDIYNVKFVPGKLEFRQRATESMMESQPIAKVIIKAPLSPPTVVYDDIVNLVESINEFTSNWTTFEYRIDPKANSPWLQGELLATEDLSGNKTVEIRIKADKFTLASKIRLIEFRQNLDLESVVLSKHVKPLVLNGTTTDMQYQINEAAWRDCSNGDTILLKKDGTPLNDLTPVRTIRIRDGRQGLEADLIEIYP